MPKAGGKRLTNRTVGRYNVKTLGLKGSENKNGKRNTKQEALKAAFDSVSTQGEEEIPELIERHIRQFLEIYKGETR